MRRPSQAPFATSTPATGIRRGLFGIACLCVLGLTAFLGISAPAASAAPGDGCPNSALRIGPSANLPDCRAYEMVSPLDKNGGDVEREFLGSGSSTSGASALGDAVAYASRTSFGAGAETGSLFPTMLSRRGPDGWSTISLAPPNESNGASASWPALEFLSEDLSRAVVGTGVILAPAAADLGGSWGLYLRDTLSPQRYTLLSHPFQPLPPDPNQSHVSSRFAAAGITPSMSHIVFNDKCRPLLPEAPSIPSDICNVFSDGGSPDSVYVATDQGQVQLVSILPPGSPYTPLFIHAGGALDPTQVYPGDNVISEDAQRIFFSILAGNVGNQVFVRENGTTTRELLPGGNSEQFYAAKASDGSVAFLGEGGTPSDLLRWDANAAPGSEISTLAPSVLGVAAMSDDATRLYFVSDAVLDAGAASGAPNLYLWREGEGNSFVATLSGSDDDIWRPIRESARARLARVTPNGDRLLFASQAQLTAHDNAGTQQVYLYDASIDRLACVSCGAGTNPSTADTELFKLETRQVAIPQRLPRNLSSNGGRVFFETAEALLPADTNDEVDVYQWSDPDGDLDGHLALVSSGKDSRASKFIDASESGDDVFFATGARLSPVDTDNHLDAYDARVEGGFEFNEPPTPCQGEFCQGNSANAPASKVSGTADFQGAGNAKPSKSRCAKGKVRRNGRCVNRKQAKKHGKKQGKKNRASNDRRVSR